jgi:hypothetical protein
MWSIISFILGIALGAAIISIYNEWSEYSDRKFHEKLEETHLRNFIKEYHYGVASRSHKKINFIVGEETDEKVS